MSLTYFFREFKDKDDAVEEYMGLISSGKINSVWGRKYAIEILDDPNAHELLKTNARYFAEALGKMTVIESETAPNEHTQKAICVDQYGRRLDLRIR